MGKSERHQSIIKLPLGINKKNNRRCLFLTEANSPIADQALFIKTIKRNQVSAMKELLDKNERQHAGGNGITRGQQADLTVSPSLEKMANSCKIIKHLISKARDTNYLNHYERVCLLYTLSFAGEEGCKLLHKAISYCINYNYNYTQHQIERRKESPMSCAKIMENFPELAETLPCDCKFNLPPRGYPSPVIFLVQSEIEMANLDPVFPTEQGKEEITMEKGDSGKKEMEEEGSILNFEQIFSSEAFDAENIDTMEEKAESEDIPELVAVLPEDAELSGFQPHSLEEDAEKRSQDDLPAAGENPSECPQEAKSEKDRSDSEMEELASGPEAWELFLEYLRLRHSQEKVRHDLEKVTAELDNFFDAQDINIIRTKMGSLQRIRREDGKASWNLVAEE